MTGAEEEKAVQGVADLRSLLFWPYSGPYPIFHDCCCHWQQGFRLAIDWM